MNYLNDLFEVAVYSCAGILLMMLGNFLIDLIIPCSFPEEIKKGNQAVGFVSAGTNIGVGLLLRAAISSPAAEAAEETLLSGNLFCSRHCIFHDWLYRNPLSAQAV